MKAARFTRSKRSYGSTAIDLFLWRAPDGTRGKDKWEAKISETYLGEHTSGLWHPCQVLDSGGTNVHEPEPKINDTDKAYHLSPSSCPSFASS